MDRNLDPFRPFENMEFLPGTPSFVHLDDIAARYAERPACTYLNRTITYRTLKTCVDKLACALDGLGVKKGNTVATILPTSPQFVIADYAIQKTGAVHVPLSTFYKSHDLIWRLNESEGEVVICLDSCLNLVNSIRSETRIRTVVVTDVNDFSEGETDPSELAGAIQLRDLITMTEADPPKVEINPQEDVALLVFSVDKTGRLAVVRLTHHQLASRTLNTLPWVFGAFENEIEYQSSMLIAVPACHAFGYWMIHACVCSGAEMLLSPDPEAIDDIEGLLKNHQPFVAPLVKRQYMQLIEKNA